MTHRNDGIGLMDVVIAMALLTTLSGALTAAVILLTQVINTGVEMDRSAETAYQHILINSSLVSGNPTLITQPITQNRIYRRVILK